MKKLFIIIICVIFTSSCAAAQKNNDVIDIAFAKIVVSKILSCDSEEWKQIDKKIMSMSTTDLAKLKEMIFEILKQDMAITTSIAETWLIYGIIYKIDDILGTLDYSDIVEGKFEQDHNSLLGSTYSGFITNDGKHITVFTTVGTIDRESAFFMKEVQLRLYIKEEFFVSGDIRKEVLKIERVQ